MRKKTVIRTIAVAISVAIMAAVFSGCNLVKKKETTPVNLSMAKNQPAVFLRTAVEKTGALYDISKLSAAGNVVNDAMKSGSVEIKGAYDKFNLNNTFYASADKGYANILDMTLADGSKLDLSAFIDKNNITVKSDALKADAASISIEYFRTMVDQSMQESGISYDELEKELTELFGGIKEMYTDSEKASKEFADKLEKELESYFKENTSFTAEEASLTVNGAEASVIKCEYTLDKEDFINLFELVYGEFDVYMEELGDIMSKFAPDDEDGATGSDADTVETDIDELKKLFEDEISSMDIKICVTVVKATGEIVLTELNGTAKGNEGELKLCGKIDGTSADSLIGPAYIEFKMEDVSKNDTLFSFVSECGKSGAVYTRTVKLTAAGDAEDTADINITASYDASSGAFSIGIDSKGSDGFALTVSGVLKTGDDFVEISVNQLKYGAITVDFTLSLKINANAEFPSVPKAERTIKSDEDLQRYIMSMDTERLMEIFFGGMVDEDQFE